MNWNASPTGDTANNVDLLKLISRGAIYDRNGRVLAFDLPSADGTVSRFYTEPSLAHTIGYVSGMRTGVAGLERSYNPTLLGLDRASTQIEQMLNKPIVGSDLILTIDSFVQRAAEDALEGSQAPFWCWTRKLGRSWPRPAPLVLIPIVSWIPCMLMSF
jgi:cell division protein FtsI/penicillin-binding protein 2